MNPALEFIEPFLARWIELLLTLTAVVGIGATLWLCITQHRNNKEDERRRQALDVETEDWMRWKEHIDESVDDFHDIVRRYGGRVRAIEAKLGLRPTPDSMPAAPGTDYLTEIEVRLGIQQPENNG